MGKTKKVANRDKVPPGAINIRRTRGGWFYEEASESVAKAVQNDAGKPSWYKEGGWSGTDQQAANAYKSIFGEEINAATLSEVRSKEEGTSDFNIDDFIKHWASSEEAIKRGINPADYGVKTLNPDDLSGASREYYDLWRRYNPNTAFTNTVSESLKWHRQSTAGNLDAFEAGLKGEIYNKTDYNPETGALQSSTVVTPEAIKTMGGEFKYRGVDTGDIFLVPTGTSIASDNTWQTVNKGDGYSILAARGNPNEGWLGEVGLGGFDELEQALGLVDISGISTPALFGRDAADKGRANQMSTFGIKESELDTVNQVASAGAKIALAATGQWWALAALEASSAKAQTVRYNDMDSGEAYKNAAISFGTAYVGGNFNLGTQLAFNAGAGYAQGLSTSEVFENTAWALAGNAIGTQTASFARAAVDDDYSFEQAAINFAGAALGQGLSSASTGGSFSEGVLAGFNISSTPEQGAGVDLGGGYRYNFGGRDFDTLRNPGFGEGQAFGRKTGTPRSPSFGSQARTVGNILFPPAALIPRGSGSAASESSTPYEPQAIRLSPEQLAEQNQRQAVRPYQPSNIRLSSEQEAQPDLLLPPSRPTRERRPRLGI